MVTLKTENGKYIVTVAGEQREFQTMSAALRCVEEYHKSRASS